MMIILITLLTLPLLISASLTHNTTHQLGLSTSIKQHTTLETITRTRHSKRSHNVSSTTTSVTITTRPSSWETWSTKSVQSAVDEKFVIITTARSTRNQSWTAAPTAIPSPSLTSSTREPTTVTLMDKRDSFTNTTVTVTKKKKPSGLWQLIEAKLEGFGSKIEKWNERWAARHRAKKEKKERQRQEKAERKANEKAKNHPAKKPTRRDVDKASRNSATTTSGGKKKEKCSIFSFLAQEAANVREWFRQMRIKRALRHKARREKAIKAQEERQERREKERQEKQEKKLKKQLAKNAENITKDHTLDKRDQSVEHEKTQYWRIDRPGSLMRRRTTYPWGDGSEKMRRRYKNYREKKEKNAHIGEMKKNGNKNKPKMITWSA